MGTIVVRHTCPATIYVEKSVTHVLETPELLQYTNQSLLVVLLEPYGTINYNQSFGIRYEMKYKFGVFILLGDSE